MASLLPRDTEKHSVLETVLAFSANGTVDSRQIDLAQTENFL